MCSSLQHVQCTCVKPSRGRVQELDTVSCSLLHRAGRRRGGGREGSPHHLATKKSRLAAVNSDGTFARYCRPPDI